MKILLSAYACEPNRGSEPGVGWHWAITLAELGHQVVVLTRAANRAVIEEYGQQNTLSENLQFAYHDVKAWSWHPEAFGPRLHYVLWQKGALKAAHRLHNQHQFDRVHHVTFVSFRQPSWLWKLGIPFIFGPVGGGETSPRCLRQGFTVKDHIKENLRDALNWVVRFDPALRKTYQHAEQIYVTSDQTQQLISKKFWHKIAPPVLAIGQQFTHQAPVKSLSPDQPIRLLFIGRFIYWKGGDLAIRAFAQLKKKWPTVQLTMVGEGPKQSIWQALARQLGVDQDIEWRHWLPQYQLADIYQQHHLFLFPSLHDSGGMVVLEALSHAMPVICLKLGGPGIMVNSSCGVAVEVKDTVNQTIDALSDQMHQVLNNPDQFSKCSQHAVERARLFSWQGLADQVYEKLTILNI